MEGDGRQGRMARCLFGHPPAKGLLYHGDELMQKFAVAKTGDSGCHPCSDTLGF